MYVCVGCNDSLENIDAQCFCGKTTMDHKGRIKGENFLEIARHNIIERSKIRKCPHCDWEGLVIPKLNMGCPNHGIWYKKPEEKHISAHQEEEPSGDTGPEGRDECEHARARRREEKRRRKERETVCRSRGQRQNRKT